MTGFGSPCGACKFLRRKCVRGFVFAPFFYHEQGATHFAAIHKVFGASNVSKLLAQLLVSHRSKAVVTISYEAQARLQDPTYGCVSHLLALQQQVVNLQVQLAYLREQAAQSLSQGTSNSKLSLHMAGPSLPEPQRVATSSHADVSTINSAGTLLPHKRAQEEQESEANWVMKKVKVETSQQFKPLEEDHIEQMINELLDYGSIELCSVMD